MINKMFSGIIPAQYSGDEIETKTSIEFSDEAKAIQFFEVAKERLLNVNNWHHVAGLVSGKFEVVNAAGEKLNRHVEIGDYFKIDIPGPGSSEGNGYDWVHVEEKQEISENGYNSIGFRVRPSSNPLSVKNETAHFYTNAATSTFIVTRENSTVNAIIIDRNLIPNNGSESILDSVRNVVIGLGAIKAFSKVQWQNLAEGLVKEEK
ncbi:MAG: hypothetical protein ABIN48_12280 [Ginsengibacter sp.]